MQAAAFRGPLALHGRYVDLAPLARTDAAALRTAARAPEVQRFLIAPIGPEVADVERLVDTILARQAAGTDLAFTIRLRASGAVLGMTRYAHIDPENGSVEIGGTFLDAAFWRSAVNTDAKLALLTHAFERGEAHRVWLQTDLRNVRSQAAIARLGAVREGVLREDRVLPGGGRRSSVVFGLLASEWPAARARLAAALERPWTPPTGAPP